MYEIYEERRIGGNNYVATGGNGHLVTYIYEEGREGMARLKMHGDGQHVYLGVERPDEDGDVPVFMPDLIAAWFAMRRARDLVVRPPGDHLDESGREYAAEVVNSAVEILRLNDHNDLANALQTTGLQLIDLASRRDMPLACVDPDDFDMPIQKWRSELQQSGVSHEDAVQQAQAMPKAALTACYIDAFQSARKNVLGATLPE